MKDNRPEAPAQSREGADTGAHMFGTLLASRPQRETARAANSLIGSVIVHGIVVVALIWATMAVGQEVIQEEQVTLIELPPEAPPPPPPPPPPQIDAPVQPQIDVAKGFQTLSVPDLVPPDIPPPQIGVRVTELDFSGVGAEGGRADGREGAPPKDDIALAPVFTPMTIRPELLNAQEVMRALTRSYPPLLRDAGIGGTTVMWFFIDESGAVMKTQLSRSSGYPALDEAAARVAETMKFSPAMNRDRKVQVWVEIPIVFTAS